MKQYQSEYSNHVHQLTVSVSKHFYATKDGKIKYQNKPMEVCLDNFHQSNKTHFVHYIIRDHCSGLFFADISCSDKMPPLEQFLMNAWCKKDDYLFCGIPELMMIPRTVEQFFPSITQSINSLGIERVKVTSGFQGGIRDTKSVENWLKLSYDKPVETASIEARRISIIMAKEKSRNGVDDKISLWKNHVNDLRYPPADWGTQHGKAQ